MEKQVEIQKLCEKVEAMLDGEKKRREVALRFVQELTEIMVEVAPDIWGEEVIVWVKEEGFTPFMYFRPHVRSKQMHKRDYDQNCDTYYEYTEYEGFYVTDSDECFGEDNFNIEDLRGSEFWKAIREIIEWIPRVMETIDERQASRDKLLSLLANSE